jgi:hypothetical protein
MSGQEGYKCQRCGRLFSDLSTAILCCAPHPPGTVAVVDSEGVAYGG